MKNSKKFIFFFSFMNSRKLSNITTCAPYLSLTPNFFLMSGIYRNKINTINFLSVSIKICNELINEYLWLQDNKLIVAEFCWQILQSLHWYVNSQSRFYRHGGYVYIIYWHANGVPSDSSKNVTIFPPLPGNSACANYDPQVPIGDRHPNPFAYVWRTYVAANIS